MSETATDEPDALTNAPSPAQTDDAEPRAEEAAPPEPDSPEDVTITPGLVIAGVVAVVVGVGLGLVMSAVSLVK